jgi:hypothetical protein
LIYNASVSARAFVDFLVAESARWSAALPSLLTFGMSAGDFGQLIRDQFDVLYEEGERIPRILPIALHTFIAGQPFRMKHIAEAFAHIARHERSGSPPLAKSTIGIARPNLRSESRLHPEVYRSTEMDNVTIFWMQLITSVFVFSIVAVWYVWPYLTKLSRNSALITLLFVHVPRYVGMTLLVTGMVDPKLPREFLSSAAYGDLLEAALAFASIFALRSNWRVAVPLVWVTNTWGLVDLLNGVRGVLQLNVPSFNLATFWYVYTFYAPLVIVSHLMIFWVLIKSKSWKI